MTREELLGSGLLELYVAGACSEEERAEVERLAALDASIMEEIAAISAAVERYALNTSVQPPSSLRSKVLAQFDEPQRPTVYTIPRSTYLRAASIGFIVGLLPALWLVYDRGQLIEKLDSTESALLAERESNSQMAQRASSLENDLSALASPSYRRVELPAVADGDPSRATVFWNEETESVLIDARSLPALENDRDYQLWAIVDGTPVSLGVVSREGHAIVQPMSSIARAEMFAITVEPAGGSVTPTLSAMKAAGKVG